ncbi:MAG TPA: carboxypeptidase regulatory-like domain-containing protein, partial [Vicinamibacterales bacterium]
MTPTVLRVCLLALLLFASGIAPVAAQQASDQTVRVVGTVRDQQNSISLPGIPVEVVGTGQIVYTDVDGRYVVTLRPGTHELKVSMEGYQDRRITVNVAPGDTPTVDIGIQMTGFAEQVTVRGELLDAETSSAEAQLGVRKHAQVITDNVGSQEMKENGD